MCTASSHAKCCCAGSPKSWSPTACVEHVNNHVAERGTFVVCVLTAVCSLYSSLGCCQVNVPRLGLDEIEVRIVRGVDFIAPGKSGVTVIVRYELTVLEEKAAGCTGMHCLAAFSLSVVVLHRFSCFPLTAEKNAEKNLSPVFNYVRKHHLTRDKRAFVSVCWLMRSWVLLLRDRSFVATGAPSCWQEADTVCDS